MSGVEYTVEFRAYSDDAWYSVNLSPEPDGDLRVSYTNISKKCDNVFHARNFSSWKEVEEFKGRFRKVSKQLQDEECRSVVNGMIVCACCEFINGDCRFYDARVKEFKGRLIGGLAMEGVGKGSGKEHYSTLRRV
ncbi:unnamed protein product [Lupinus luteus]|uniref:SAWADEE domain-containing protein n=1 Tax=Lupinus luteus TaxID=3873 RepID=A0AAV1VXT1_LUPLU